MTLICIDRSQSETHKGSFLQGGKTTVNNNNQRKRNSTSPPLSSQDMPVSEKKQDRGTSDPDRRAVQSNSSRYKTELCRPFEESGSCKYGDKCQFAHGRKELRNMARHPKYKTELCRTFHSTGLCPYGPRCHFIHNSEQTKKSLLTNLTGSPSPPARTDSLGSDGDDSPPSSQSGSPTGSKSFEDLFHTNPLSPTLFYPQDNVFSNFQNYIDYNPLYDLVKASVYASVDVFSDKHGDNVAFQSGPVLDLRPIGPVTPPTPVDTSMGFFRLPIFDAFQKQ